MGCGGSSSSRENRSHNTSGGIESSSSDSHQDTAHRSEQNPLEARKPKDLESVVPTGEEDSKDSPQARHTRVVNSSGEYTNTTVETFVQSPSAKRPTDSSDIADLSTIDNTSGGGNDSFQLHVLAAEDSGNVKPQPRTRRSGSITTTLIAASPGGMSAQSWFSPGRSALTPLDLGLDDPSLSGSWANLDDLLAAEVDPVGGLVGREDIVNPVSAPALKKTLSFMQPLEAPHKSVSLSVRDPGAYLPLLLEVLLHMEMYCVGKYGKRTLSTVVTSCFATGTGSLVALALSEGLELQVLQDRLRRHGRGLIPGEDAPPPPVPRNAFADEPPQQGEEEGEGEGLAEPEPATAGPALTFGDDGGMRSPPPNAMGKQDSDISEGGLHHLSYSPQTTVSMTPMERVCRAFFHGEQFVKQAHLAAAASRRLSLHQMAGQQGELDRLLSNLYRKGSYHVTRACIPLLVQPNRIQSTRTGSRLNLKAASPLSGPGGKFEKVRRVDWQSDVSVWKVASLANGVTSENLDYQPLNEAQTTTAPPSGTTTASVTPVTAGVGQTSSPQSRHLGGTSNSFDMPILVPPEAAVPVSSVNSTTFPAGGNSSTGTEGSKTLSLPVQSRLRRSCSIGSDNEEDSEFLRMKCSSWSGADPSPFSLCLQPRASFLCTISVDGASSDTTVNTTSGSSGPTPSDSLLHSHFGPNWIRIVIPAMDEMSMPLEEPTSLGGTVNSLNTSANGAAAQRSVGGELSHKRFEAMRAAGEAYFNEYRENLERVVDMMVKMGPGKTFVGQTDQPAEKLFLGL